jgi:RNA polymerase sigma-54 factor
MRMSFGQEMRMAQKQVLAPRMIQSMEILQLPVMALEERIEEEIQNNETLELEEVGQVQILTHQQQHQEQQIQVVEEEHVVVTIQQILLLVQEEKELLY